MEKNTGNRGLALKKLTLLAETTVTIHGIGAIAYINVLVKSKKPNQKLKSGKIVMSKNKTLSKGR